MQTAAATPAKKDSGKGSEVARLALNRRVRWSFVAEIQEIPGGFRVEDRGWFPLLRLLLTWGQPSVILAVVGLAIAIAAMSVGVIGLLGGPFGLLGLVGAFFLPLAGVLVLGIERSKRRRAIELDTHTTSARAYLAGQGAIKIEQDRVFLTSGTLTVVGHGGMQIHRVLVLRAGEVRVLLCCTSSDEQLEVVRRSLPVAISRLPSHHEDECLCVRSMFW